MFRKQTSFDRFLALAIAVAFAVSASPSRAAALKECAVPDLATTPVERLGGKRFSVEVRGTGPDVVLIPGLSTSRSVWDKDGQGVGWQISAAPCPDTRLWR
ncbi:MAG: hypothetical protein IPP23_10950 [Sphingomonadales bacterium]|nr:hypothetical protein [Sphingomonadales bacterium]